MGIENIITADCIEAMRDMDDASVSAIITDPPYGLSFMGKEWDHGVPGVPFWTEALRVLKPGGHALIFGGTRTFHRLACAVEDAGFEIRDCLSWMYGQGFPKSLDVSKAIDKAAGAEREVDCHTKRATHSRHAYADSCAAVRCGSCGNSRNGTSCKCPLPAPATDAARQWHGYGTALKPAWEPIILARKPLAGTVAANCLEHGTGALNIDGCRVGGNVDEMRGRWPANVVLDEEAGAMLGEPSRFFYCAKASKKDRGPDNNHPTVKPVELMRWLVRLLTGPGHNLIFDPFAGSGTTGVACKLEGVPFVLIEREAKYVEIINNRLR